MGRNGAAPEKRPARGGRGGIASRRVAAGHTGPGGEGGGPGEARRRGNGPRCVPSQGRPPVGSTAAAGRRRIPEARRGCLQPNAAQPGRQAEAAPMDEGFRHPVHHCSRRQRRGGGGIHRGHRALLHHRRPGRLRAFFHRGDHHPDGGARAAGGHLPAVRHPPATQPPAPGRHYHQHPVRAASGGRAVHHHAQRHELDSAGLPGAIGADGGAANLLGPLSCPGAPAASPPARPGKPPSRRGRHAGVGRVRQGLYHPELLQPVLDFRGMQHLGPHYRDHLPLHRVRRLPRSRRTAVRAVLAHLRLRRRADDGVPQPLP